jgi:crotonobetainyl-CoA:carnitine CoA-transferase CaiB-like acyl-CoA transferase
LCRPPVDLADTSETFKHIKQDIEMTQIISHVRAVDLSLGRAGNIAALLLAESGADVIKVEARAGHSERGSGGYAVFNRSKRNIALDVDQAADRETLDMLLAGADVLIHDCTPAQAKALGLDEAGLAAHPHLIIASVTAYPLGHPLADLPVDDALVMASTGLCGEQWSGAGRAGPSFILLPVASWGAALLLAIGIVSRLVAMQRGGRPGPVRTSLAQGAMLPGQFFRHRAERPDYFLTMAKSEPPTLFQCSDGHWLHMMGSPEAMPAMQDGMAAMSADEKTTAEASWPTGEGLPNPGPWEHVFKTRPRDFWIAQMRAHDIAVMPVMPFGDFYNDAESQRCGNVVAVDDPALGRVLQPGPIIETTPPAAVRHALHMLDADKDEILADWSPRPAPQFDTARDGTLPLAGVKVLDFGYFLAGPLGASLLADLGADVIKVEAPSGDPMRYAAWAFVSAQRNKQALALDMRKPESHPVMARLVAGVDIVHHNQRLPVAQRLGIDEATLRASNPELIYCHVSAYGAKGERKDWPGYDQLFQAMTGWEWASAGEGAQKPAWLRFGMMDHIAGAASTLAAVLALYDRDRTGRRHSVSASLLASALLTAGEVVQRADGSLTPFAGLDMQQLGTGDGRRLYQCADGWGMVRADAAALALLRAKLGDDLQAGFGRLTLAAAFAAASAAKAHMVTAPQAHCDAYLDDADNRAAGLSVRFAHPTYGQFDAIGAHWDFGTMPTRLDRAAPLLGEDSRAVLQGLGYADDDIDAMIAAKLVKEHG